MNLSKRFGFGLGHLQLLIFKLRSFLPRQKCKVFGESSNPEKNSIGPIFVINLDRQPQRCLDILRELDRILDINGKPISQRMVRVAACDAQSDWPHFLNSAEIGHTYTLKDQLFVEPQPDAMPDTFDLERPIEMSRAEIAVAHSHVKVWKEFVQSNASYALVLEDDVWFQRDFGALLEQAWSEIANVEHENHQFDVLYVSYDEVRFGAPKEFISKNVFRPERGLWFLSGYILFKKGAQSLLDLLPTHGPIDLWINHKFQDLKVLALRNSVVNQRRDLQSTNSYSILPMLSRIGILDSGDASLFQRRPIYYPIFAFGDPGSGLSSLAMALSMLGYRCCSDFECMPEDELRKLITGHLNCGFDAYVNIGTLETNIQTIVDRYPNAKYIFLHGQIEANSNILEALASVDVLHLKHDYSPSWRPLCEHLQLAPPDGQYPIIPDVGLRRYQRKQLRDQIDTPVKRLRFDTSPWVAKQYTDWFGLHTSTDRRANFPAEQNKQTLPNYFDEDFTHCEPTRWALRTDTFPGNLALFRPANVTTIAGEGLSLAVFQEPMGVREFSAAAITYHNQFLYGRFEVILKATNVPGLVTGFFLHRHCPRQEIDIEILGKRPDQLVMNVFYNPGTYGAKFDYGYRGTPVTIELGFDASKDFHRYAIEWDPDEIRWFVDEKLIHRRATWEPTPIPHLPMTLHINTWPSKSREFAGNLAIKHLPASTIVRRVIVKANHVDVATSNSAVSTNNAAGAEAI